jgi:hypothetical protein
MAAMQTTRILILPVLLICLQCSCMLFATGRPSHVAEVKETMKDSDEHVPEVDDVHPFGGVSGIGIGAWATYQVDGRTITLAAVAAEGEDVWIEVIDEAEPRSVSARLVSPHGEVLKAFFRLLSDGAVHEQKLCQTPAKRKKHLEEVDREVRDEEVKVGERTLAAKRVTIVWEDLDGRQTTEEALWSAEVPGLFEGSEFGGLVQRGEIRLLRFGVDAKPLIPKQ